MKEDNSENWRDIEPKNWSCNHFVQYMKELGLDKVYFDFYNSSYVEKDEERGYLKKNLGFRACSIDRSVAWALETKFLKHKCKLPAHAGRKHSELSKEYPVATWVCPESGEHSYSPLRWKEYRGFVYQRWVPIDFKTNFDILKMAGCARTWFWELSLYHNNWRDMELYPVKAIGKKITAEEYDLQWNRVVSHPYILEIDASKKSNAEGRRDLLDSNKKFKYLTEGNEMISKINAHLTGEMNLSWDNFEWWWSGNGLYCITNPWLNSFINLKEKGDKGDKGDEKEKLNDYYKKNLEFWNNHIDKLMEKTGKEINYLKIDNSPQHLRSYIKAPFSLHQDFDRICLPMTNLFGGNGRIDLTSEKFRKLLDPRNLTKDIIDKYFRVEENGIKINDFLKVYR